MTNLEYYKDEIKVAFVHDEYLCDSIRRVASRYGYDTKGFVSEGKVIDWLLEEHKEKIKLTEFEHDVLKAFTRLHTYVEGDGIENFRTLQELNRDGWFNGIENLSIKEILENCEVEDR